MNRFFFVSGLFLSSKLLASNSMQNDIENLKRLVSIQQMHISQLIKQSATIGSIQTIPFIGEPVSEVHGEGLGFV